MKALLIWPKFQSFSFWNFEEVCKLAGAKYMTPPLGLLTVAALLPSDWELRLVDENVRLVVEDDLEWADLVLVGAKIVHRKRACDVVRWAKDLDRPVVVGGPDATLNPRVYERAGADYLCLGEGEVTVPRMLADLEAGVTRGVYVADEMADLSQTPPPRFDLIDFRDYLYVGLQYSRGCPYNCEFCNVIDLFEGYRTKTLEQVLAELDHLYALGYRGQVDFFDDNLVGHMHKAKDILRGLVEWLKAHKFPFTFSTSATLNIAKDEELLALLREARFRFLLIGIETPSEDALKRAQKPQNTGFSIAEACDRIYRLAGTTVHSGFLLGLDGEPDDIGDHIVQCIDETHIPWVMAGMVYPLPGTQLSRRLDREGRLFPKARTFDDEAVRDQISAGLQFRPERPAELVIEDLVRVLEHAYDPDRYFARCADVALRLGTIPVMVPGWRMFFRNVRIFLRLAWRMTWRRRTRRPFWRAFFKVLRRNRVGIEALVTLSVLFLHFEQMMPYCFEQLERQRREVAELGEQAWLDQHLAEPDAASADTDTASADTDAPPSPAAEPASPLRAAS